MHIFHPRNSLSPYCKQKPHLMRTCWRIFSSSFDAIFLKLAKFSTQFLETQRTQLRENFWKDCQKSQVVLEMKIWRFCRCCWHVGIDTLVIQNISLRYFQKIIWCNSKNKLCLSSGPLSTWLLWCLRAEFGKCRADTATRCNALQRTATCCSTLQHACTSQTLANDVQIDAVNSQLVTSMCHCNALQHTATHCT